MQILLCCRHMAECGLLLPVDKSSQVASPDLLVFALVSISLHLEGI